jgi:glycosidase
MVPIIETPKTSPYFPQGFSISLAAWRRLQVRRLQKQAAARGTAVRLGERVAVARALAERMNAARDLSRPGMRPARAGEVLAMGLLTDILRHVAETYCRDVCAGVMAYGLDRIRQDQGPEVAEKPVRGFVNQFPPEAVRTGEVTEEEFLRGTAPGLGHREMSALEMILLSVSNGNRALEPYRELHDDMELRRTTPYGELLLALDAFFSEKPPVPGTGLPLLATLWAPILASPDSLDGQLEFVRKRWHALLPPELLDLLEMTRGVLLEETAWRGFGPGPVQALEFGLLHDQGYEEFEAFSVDQDWMPNLVLIAKSVYVWLDQLSKKYQRPIVRLDQVPDEELDQLAHWGFTGVWLIGIWERSEASRNIKQRMGNPEALASAYSLYDYEIAYRLGGEEAFRNLAARAARRGIRLASDMVPNHVGLYSKWVIEHPDWFIQLPYPPFPSYRFSGPDLSLDPRVELQIEDGYWEHRDAAVVFRRVDRWTGDTRYIYHGNDGTNMPWNDTAQLNFTLPEVREAVMQAILHVARLFPIIRFDAAMTMAKRHFQRLWFPKPGEAGAIPSRAEHGMSRPEFDQVFPNEFWREVVDRVAAEAPGTLLLAEAFWLMEGYFVRTLGMHRVYNSAFMNMLKMEENAKYRQTVKNVLEFSPEVLQRFVNFMNNPDEETAVAQFGKGDKYVGVAMLMVTMPGLPMFGHGQIEGFAEKYGMEYPRAYWDESVDRDLVARHEHEIFPLMRRRYLFSGSRHFALFDLVTPGGAVDENVFAYTNRLGNERALIIYNNCYYTTRGVVHTSTAINEASADAPRLRRLGLGEALALNTTDTCYYFYRDHRTGLEYLRYARDLAENGLHVELQGYQYLALIEWREVHDLDNSWGRLHGLLAGQGVPSVEEAYQEMHLSPVLEPFRRLMSAGTLRLLARPGSKKAALDPFRAEMRAFLEAVGHRLNRSSDPAPVLLDIERELALIRRFRTAAGKAAIYPEMAAYLREGFPAGRGLPLDFWRVPLVWSVVRRIGMAAAPEPVNGFDVAATSAAWLREWFLTKPIARAFQDLDGDAWRAGMDARLVRICVAHGGHLMALQREPWAPSLDLILHDPDVRAFLGVNRFGGHTWLHREQLERMLHALYLTQCIAHWPLDEDTADGLMRCLDDVRTWLDAAADAGYDLDRMFDSLK